MDYKGIDLNDNDLVKILETLGFTNIRVGANEIKFAWRKGSNPNGSCIFKNSFKYVHWSENLTGDIIDLIKEKTGCSFIKAIRFIEDITNKKYNKKLTKEVNYVDEFIKSLPKKIEKDIIDKDILLQYPRCTSKLFLEDGIGLLAHDIFDIRFDDDTNRILIPIRDENGDLLGILGRYNKKNIIGKIPKYLSIIPHERKYTLFGLYENKGHLSDTIILVESEKSVMRAFSMGYRNVLALGGLLVNQYKRRIFLKLKPKKIILALDEGISREYIIESAKTLISPSPLIKWHVGFIDSNKAGLGEKNCIFDESKEKCENILKNNIEYIC